jgi:hypothetical protein
MAVPVWAYRAVRGMTPKMSGEDFYFLQKLRKFGKMVFHNPEKVYPAARFSDRVYFGTGPAMIRGDQGDWESYPIYSCHYFDEIRSTTDLFPAFFHTTENTVVVSFLRRILNEQDPFGQLRENFRDQATFIRSCHEKFDGLRILQFLKDRQKNNPATDEENLREYLDRIYPLEFKDIIYDPGNFSFEKSSITELDLLRNFLVRKEEAYQTTSVPSLPGQQLPSA